MIQFYMSIPMGNGCDDEEYLKWIEDGIKKEGH
jgi:hypothetical protein